MIFFNIVFSVVILQRVVELLIARKNEQWMRRQGAYEVGAEHYPIMLLLHIGFFVTFYLEVSILNRMLPSMWTILFIIFLVAQFIRIWCLVTLGKFWNTKIIILPGTNIVRSGPYRWIRHPNYAVVATEFLILPLLFGATFTAILFSILNLWMLSVRIPIEEQALKVATNYQESFETK